MSRTVCSREVLIDGASGGCAVTLVSTGETPAKLDTKTLDLIRPEQVEIWTATIQKSKLSAEEYPRGNRDQKITNVILLDFFREEQTLSAVATISGQAWRLLTTLIN